MRRSFLPICVIFAACCEVVSAEPADSNGLQDNLRRYEAETERQRNEKLARVEAEIAQIRSHPAKPTPLSKGLSGKAAREARRYHAEELRNKRRWQADRIRELEAQAETIRSEVIRPSITKDGASVGHLSAAFFVVRVVDADRVIARTITSVRTKVGKRNAYGQVVEPSQYKTAYGQPICFRGVPTGQLVDGGELDTSMPFERIEPYRYEEDGTMRSIEQFRVLPLPPPTNTKTPRNP